MLIISILVLVCIFLLILLIRQKKRTEQEVQKVANKDEFISECLFQIEGLKDNTQKDKNLELELSEQIKRLQEELHQTQYVLKSDESIIEKLDAELNHHKDNLSLLLQSNLTSMPWLAGMMADYLTFDLEVEAKKLAWGSNVKREKKVASIREIRAEAKARIEEAKYAIYQLEYLRALVPGIDEILATDYHDLHFDGKIPEHDPILDYLTREEWQKMSENEKNQLALERYIDKRKSNWQIGRDYELSVAYEYIQKGYHVDTYGSYMRLEDLGRDLVATKQNRTLVIQCKYWSTQKQIHEKHVYQLYGTSIGYCIEHNISTSEICPILVTNTKLAPMAKTVADYLGVVYVENHGMKEFPRIKCNIGRDEFGNSTKIYHLPMDLQYDATKIEKPGEFFAFSVEEAVKAGFRRAYRWYGD